MKLHAVKAGLAFPSLVVLGLLSSLATGEMVPFKGTAGGSYEVTIVPRFGRFVGAGDGSATQPGKATYELSHMVRFVDLPSMGTGPYSFTPAGEETLEAPFAGFVRAG